MNVRKQYLEHLTTLTDEALAVDATWDDDSFAELHRRYGHLLMVYLLRHTNSIDRAHKASAVAWKAVCQGCKIAMPGELKPGSKLRPWLFSVAMNAAIDLCREAGITIEA